MGVKSVLFIASRAEAALRERLNMVFNYIVSYDLNGKTPTHAEMDKHIKAIKGVVAGRLLETVWLIRCSATIDVLTNYLRQKLSPNDSLIVVHGAAARFQNTLPGDSNVVTVYNGKPTQRVA